MTDKETPLMWRKSTWNADLEKWIDEASATFELKTPILFGNTVIISLQIGEQKFHDPSLIGQPVLVITQTGEPASPITIQTVMPGSDSVPKKLTSRFIHNLNQLSRLTIVSDKNKLEIAHASSTGEDGSGNHLH